MNNMKKRWRSIFMGIANIPMLNADIVTGISLMLVFLVIGDFLSHFDRELPFGFWTVLIGHITFNIPVRDLKRHAEAKADQHASTYEAALDLGATPCLRFLQSGPSGHAARSPLRFPPGIYTMSLDDFIITHFAKGAGFDTLSTKIYTEVKKGIKPEMYALSTPAFPRRTDPSSAHPITAPKRRKKAD